MADEWTPGTTVDDMLKRLNMGLHLFYSDPKGRWLTMAKLVIKNRRMMRKLVAQLKSERAAAGVGGAVGSGGGCSDDEDADSDEVSVSDSEESSE